MPAGGRLLVVEMLVGAPNTFSPAAVADDHGPITIEARILGQLAAMTTTAASGAWSLTLPAGALGASGSAVVLRAVDAIGNATADSPTTSPLQIGRAHV